MNHNDREDFEMLLRMIINEDENYVARWWDHETGSNMDRGIWLLALATEVVDLVAIDNRIDGKKEFPEVMAIIDRIKYLG